MDPKNLYYVIDGTRINSKNQALILADGDTKKISFYQDDAYWDQQNWQEEPSQSFEELCRIRCHQLRDNYDWVCLWLSAGYDSTTVLKHFIDSNVKIDEIAYNYRIDYYDDPEIPYIESAALYYQKYHNSRLFINRVITDANYTLNLYRTHRDILVSHKGQNQKLSKSNATFLHQYNTYLLSQKESTPVSRVDIYGKEKPRVDLRDGWWYSMSIDKMWQEDLQSPVEYFYISDQLPALHIKQCHMVANWFETLPEINHQMVHRVQSNDMFYYRDWNVACGRIDVECPDSQNGRVKKDYTFNLASPDGLKLLEHIKKNDMQMFNYLTDQEKQLRKIIGNDLNPVIFGKSWLLKPFQPKISL
jgi:hypothetical protein